MTLQECYEKIGGNYDEVLSRLTKKERVEKFMLRFLKDDSYGELCKALEQKKYDEVFRGIHTLKGVALNLGFLNLYEVSDRMTEAVRGGVPLLDENLFLEVEKAYHQTVEAIKAYQVELEDDSFA